MRGGHEAPDRQVRLVIAPGDDFYGRHDDRWKSELYELQQALEREVRESLEATAVQEGTKGIDLAVLIVSLGSAGAFTAAVEAFKAWLAKKPDQRSIDIDYDVHDDAAGHRRGSIRIDATNVDSGDLATLASALPLKPER